MPFVATGASTHIVHIVVEVEKAFSILLDFLPF